MIFWIPWAIDAVAALVVVAVFFIGLADGSVSSFNMGLWLAILAVCGGIVGGGLALRAVHPRAAIVLAMLTAIPVALVGLLFLVIMVVPARWN